MLRGILKKTCFIVNIMVLVICSNLLLAMGATGTSTISADKDKVLHGEQVTVHIEIKATEKLYYCEFLLNYDDTKLKFISTDGNADTDKPAGIIPYRYGEAVLSDLVEFDIVFEAIGDGISTISISDYAIIENSGEKPKRVDMTINNMNLQIGEEETTHKETTESKTESDTETDTIEKISEGTENIEKNQEETESYINNYNREENTNMSRKINPFMMAGIAVAVLFIGVVVILKRKKGN